jgi:hypothetical protein
MSVAGEGYKHALHKLCIYVYIINYKKSSQFLGGGNECDLRSPLLNAVNPITSIK